MDSGPGSGANVRAELAPGVWLDAHVNRLRVFPQPPTFPPEGLDRWVDRVIMSPDRSRWVPLGPYYRDGVDGQTEVRTNTGDVAFNLPARIVVAAAFSPEGDTIFLVANWTDGLDRSLRALSATDGQLLVTAPTLDENSGGELDIVIHPDLPWLLLLDRLNSIHVHERGTLARIAVLDRGMGTEGYSKIGLDAANHRLHVLLPWSPSPYDFGLGPRPAWIIDFDLVPPGQTPLVLEF